MAFFRRSQPQPEPEEEEEEPEQEPGEPHVWSLEEKVEFLIARRWELWRIAGKCAVPIEVVVTTLDQIYARKMAEVSDERRAIQAQHLISNDAIVREAWRKYRQTGNLRVLRIAMDADARTRRMYGLDAPKQTLNIEWKARAEVDPDTHRRIMADPRARAAFLTLEEFTSGVGSMALEPPDPPLEEEGEP